MTILNRLNKTAASLVGAKGKNLEIARARLSILSGVCMVLFAIVIIRVGDLTLLQAPREPRTDMTGYVDGGYVDRADIVDRNGVLLATSLQVPSLYADPTMIENKAFIARELENILGVDDLDARLDKSGRFVWIKRGITPEQHYAINQLGQPGLGFRNETRRFYPQGHLVSHVVGYTNIDGKGLSGIELQYDNRLKKGGEALVLNVDIRVQHALVKSLSQTMGAFKAKAAIGGVVDVETGEIIAAASLPDFDPHHVSKATNNQKFNRFATGVYEMGSTFKLFSTANFLEETGQSFSHSFDATKPLKEGRFTINDYHGKKRVLTVPEVFIYSSNIGTALMGRSIGTDSMKSFYKDLGFFDRLEIDFPSRGKPLTPNPWRDVNTLTAAYGHGIAVSPLHVLRATATIVNGGVVPQLSFVKNNDGAVQIQKRVLSMSTAHKMRQLLRLNVTNGSGGKSDVVGYMVGGKTGTSEKSSAGGYDKDKLLSSFVGVFPSHAPRYAVLAILDEPQGTKASYGYATGGWTGAPVVGSVIRDMASILAISPTMNETNLTAGLDRYLKKTSNISPVGFER